jgi:predicted Fe-Mo cluster-binding NifX family protein
MRIAVPVTDNRIPNHFGHCAAFLLADVEGGAVRSEAVVPNPGHGPGGPPPLFVMAQGVTQVLAWGMPPHARERLTNAGIKVQLGVTGEPRAALRAFLAGTLQLTGEALDAGGGCEPSRHDHGHAHGSDGGHDRGHEPGGHGHHG